MEKYVVRNENNDTVVIMTSTNNCLRPWDRIHNNGTWIVLDKSASDWFTEKLYSLIAEELDDFESGYDLETDFGAEGLPDNLDTELIKSVDGLIDIIGKAKVEMMKTKTEKNEE